ncbi:uncharacterized protein LOC110252420 [Exaiptasia diaphana]|uniref:Uncharacterized protein n=1 Tax=Exaiptasia diaphana TaxID=2652724 RepID=A0A913Y576_EXADI|nr:uncharacterized protein LOC110252420 [Exaiptasia diaphana]KXJ28934.1 hypothetical protein AC249_AIPGENE1222 [Exaiptasia diaphana]
MADVAFVALLCFLSFGLAQSAVNTTNTTTAPPNSTTHAPNTTAAAPNTTLTTTISGSGSTAKQLVDEDESRFPVVLTLLSIALFIFVVIVIVLIVACCVVYPKAKVKGYKFI